MSITTLNYLSLNYDYYIQAISTLKNRRLTRNTAKLIHEYDNFIRNNLYDQLRIITEIYYKNQQENYLLYDYKILNKFKNTLITNLHSYNPITYDEFCVVKAFYDTIYNTH